MNKSHLLINEPPLQVLPSLAVEIGLNEAIVIQQLHYWLNNPKVGVDREGFKWIFNTYQEWQENFPFWSVSTIQRIFSNLEEKGLIISEKLDKKSHDMTKFYRLNYDELCKMEHVKMESSDMSNRHDVNMYSETTTENTTEKQNILEKSDPAWTILAGQDVTEEMVKTIQLRDVAPKMFEKALGFSKPLPWWNGKDWSDFGQWVCDRYDENHACFGEYQVWRGTPYTKGGISNQRIRGFVKEFYDSWDMFLMAKSPKTDETRPQYSSMIRTIGQ